MSRKRDSPKMEAKNGYLYADTKSGKYRIAIDIFNAFMTEKKEVENNGKVHHQK